MKLINLFARKQQQVTYISLIGKGGFGNVWKCKLTGDMTIYACKEIKKSNPLVQNEIAIWQTLVHPNVLRLVKLIELPTTIQCVMELMDESLYDRHKRMAKLGSKPRIVSILNQLLQICDAMIYLHGKRILHRDIKSNNVLCTENRTVLSDFGLSRFLIDGKMTAETGSYRWMAPEVIRHEGYDQKCDVYSFSMLMYEMMTLCLPFNNYSPIETAFAVARGVRPPLPPIPDYMRQMIDDCWQHESSKRPTFCEIGARLIVIRAKKDSFGSIEMACRGMVNSHDENRPILF